MPFRWPSPVPGRHTAGFSLVELLIVISILLALIGMLMPALGVARENARRTVCASNIRSLTQITMAYANDHNGEILELHNSDGRWGDNTQRNPYWFSLKARDFLLQHYPSLERDNFYCPSNMESWNRDDFWTWPGNSSSVWGYFYFGGASNWYNRSVGTFSYADAGGELTFANSLYAKPSYDVLWADLNRECCGFGWFGPNRRGANHFGIGTPAGSNEGFLDGHVEWVHWTQMKLRMWQGGTKMYF